MVITSVCIKDDGTLVRRPGATREDYYRDLAAIIANNPQVSYAMLMTEYGLTSWAIRRAVKLHGIKRACGRRSPAYRQGGI